MFPYMVALSLQGAIICDGFLEWCGLCRGTLWERATLLDEFLDSPVYAMTRFYPRLFFKVLLPILFAKGPWVAIGHVLVWLGVRRAHELERPRPLDHLLASPLHAIMPHVYRILVALGTRRDPPPQAPYHPVTVVCISDTFSERLALPAGDLLIHAGNISSDGTRASIQREIDWMANLPYQHKVFVSGYHDSWFDENSRKPEDQDSQEVMDFTSVHHLNGRSVTLNFGPKFLTVYGAPDVPEVGAPYAAYVYRRPWPVLIVACQS